MGKTKSRDKNAVFSDVMAIENVSEGEHVLIVRKEGYAERVVHPKVNRESTTRSKIVLKRIFVPNVRVVTTRGTHEGVFVSSGVNGLVIEVKLGITRSFSKDEIRKIEYLSDVK
jgi:phosphatidate phosphatase APP1